MSSEDSDYALILRIADQDMAAYRELLGKHLNRFIGIAERMLGNRQDAEDITQEMCLKIWHEAERWKPSAKFTTWLYRVTLNACIDHRRKARRFSSIELDHIADTAALTEQRLMFMQKNQQVRVALDALPVRQRAAILLHYYENLSNQMAAESMGIRLGAYEQLLFRARQNLKKSLQHLLMELPDERKIG